MDLFSGTIDTQFCDVASDNTLSLSQIVAQPLPFDLNRSLVLIWNTPSLEDLCAYLQLLNSDHVVMLMQGDLSTDIKESTEKLYAPKVVYDASGRDIPGYEKIGSTAYHLKIDASIDLELVDNKEINTDSKQNNNGGDSDKPQHSIHPQIKLLLSTSGSTGSPKMVLLSMENLQANASSIATALPIVSGDVVPLNLPLGYAYGLSLLHSNLGRVQKMLCNFPSVLSPEFEPLMQKHQATTLAGVPFVYQMLWRSGFAEKQWPHIRYLTQAGGHLPAVLKAKFIEMARKQGFEFYAMYGQTEATARMSVMSWDDLNYSWEHGAENKAEKILDNAQEQSTGLQEDVTVIPLINSIGKPIEDGKFRIDKETGELLYSGPNVFGGYAEQPEDLLHWNQLKWLATGDIGRQDADGFWYVEGRIKRITKLFGERVQLDYLEKMISEFSGFSPVVCIETGENKVGVYYETPQSLRSLNRNALGGGDGKKKQNFPEDAVKQFLKEKLKLRSSVFCFQSVAEIPITDRGKVDYSRLQELV